MAIRLARHFRRFAQFEMVDSESEVPGRIDHMLADLDNYRCASDDVGVGDSLIAAVREFVGA